MRKQVREKAGEAPWRAVGLVQEQFAGLVEGYQARAHEELQQQQQRKLQQLQDRGGSSGEGNGGSSREGNGGGSGGGGSDDAAVGWLALDDLVFLNNNGDLYDIIDHLQQQDKKKRKEESAATTTRGGGSAIRSVGGRGSAAGSGGSEEEAAAGVFSPDGSKSPQSPQSTSGPRIHIGDVSSGSTDDAPSVFNMVALAGRCSALIKVLPDLSDVFIGHR